MTRERIPQADLLQLCELAQKAARAAGEYIQSKVDTQYGQGRKEGGTSIASQVVTEVDLRAQEIILTYLQDSFDRYDLGLLTEEAADDQSRLKQAHFWCIDPLDGTLPFTEGRPGYAVSIALVSQAGDPVIGVVCLPDQANCYAALKDGGVQLNGHPFKRPATESPQRLQVCLDRSFTKEEKYGRIKSRLSDWAALEGLEGVAFHTHYGAVRNAITVMTFGRGCYFKFPKEEQGGGSIWDFAATRLLFEELGMPVSNFSGQRLHLNDPASTFMHRVGILYASDAPVATGVMGLG